MRSKLFKNKMLTASFAASGALVIGGWIWAITSLKSLSQPLIIHFSGYYGIDRVGGLNDLHVAAVLGVLGVVFNMLISLELEERGNIFGRIGAVATMFFAALIFIGFAVIIKVN